MSIFSLLFFHNQETGATDRTAIQHVEAHLFHDRIHTTAQKTAPGEKQNTKVLAIEKQNATSS